MTESEICGSYRRAKNQTEQVKILTELTCKSRLEIIAILVRNGEELPKRIIDGLYKRMDALESEIQTREREYREIANALNGKKE